MTATPMPPEYQVAALVNGLATVTFVARPFRRVITSVAMNSIVTATVKMYRGLIDVGGIVNEQLFATPNTYIVPFNLPAGQALYVVYSAKANPVNAAYARIFQQRES